MNTNENKNTQLAKTEEFDFSALLNIHNAFEIMEAGEGAKIRHTTTTDTKRLYNAINSPSKPVKQILNDTIEVVDIVVTSSDVHEDKDDETSKIVNTPIVHFFTLDGEHYSSMSRGIVKATEDLLSLGIIPTQEEPMSLHFVTGESKKGVFHSFEWV